MNKKRIVVALGGNALGNTPEEQLTQVSLAAESLVDLIEQGHQLIISHGNGPQVGMISLAFAEASKVNDRIIDMPLAECTAMSQGYIGYHLQSAMYKTLNKRSLNKQVVSLVTQVLVESDDQAFSNPTKPIGSYYSLEQAEDATKADKTLIFKEDAGRGYRRMVASPKPSDIIEKDIIKHMIDQEYVVVSCGGGGIPVLSNDQGLKRADAVIDKDLATAKLAEVTNADYLVILTAVDRVSINFGKPNQEDLDVITLDEAKDYCKQGHFAEGSMLPKVEAAMMFVQSGENKKAIIVSLERAHEALSGLSGTTIVM